MSETQVFYDSIFRSNLVSEWFTKVGRENDKEERKWNNCNKTFGERGVV